MVGRATTRSLDGGGIMYDLEEGFYSHRSRPSQKQGREEWE